MTDGDLYGIQYTSDADIYFDVKGSHRRPSIKENWKSCVHLAYQQNNFIESAIKYDETFR